MRMKLLLFTGLIIGSIGLSFLLSDNLYAKNETVQTSPTILFAADLPTTGEPAADADADQPASSCRVEGIGWIICPVAREMSKFVDAAYGFVNSLLKVQPLTTTGEQANIYNAWAIMRNFANVAFVIAFMVIIFSQLTSAGLNNYGIKKMLPRLIVAAILVNASFWICAIAVDISNILGSSINSLFVSMEAGLPSTPGEGATTFSNVAGGSATGWEAITGLVLAGTAVGALYIGLSALLPALLAALLAIVTVFMVLTLRQALIVLLIIISPLAFVAYLLPNTESMFKKWQALFKTLLLMYPIIAGIFGASALASKVVMSTAKGEYEIAIQIMGALIAIIPLALTPIVMKTAGGLLNRFGGVVNNPNKGPFDRMRKGADGVRKRQEGRRAIREMDGRKTMGFGKYKRAAQRSRMESGIDSEKKRAEADFLSKKTMDSERFRNNAAGGLNVGPSASGEAMQRALNSAIDVQNQIEVAEIKAASAQIEHAAIPNNMVQALAMGGREYEHENEDGSKEMRAVTLGDSEAMRKAAIQQQVGSGQADKISELVDNYGKKGADGNRTNEGVTLANALQSSSSRPGWIGAKAIEDIRQGEAAGKDGDSITATQIRGAVKSGAYSAEKIASVDAGDLEMVANVMNQTAHKVTDPNEQKARDALVVSAQVALTDPLLSTKLAKRGTNVEAIAQGAPGTKAGPPSPAGIAAAAAALGRSAPPQTVNVQNAPGVLNVVHNNTNTPANSRTTPPSNTTGYGPAPNSTSGLYVPNGYQQQQTPPQQPPQNPPQPPSAP